MEWILKFTTKLLTVLDTAMINRPKLSIIYKKSELCQSVQQIKQIAVIVEKQAISFALSIKSLQFSQKKIKKLGSYYEFFKKDVKIEPTEDNIARIPKILINLTIQKNVFT